jgi:centractin
MAEVLANQPIVIDNGSGSLKAGFAGEEVPKLIFPSYVGRPKHKKVMASVVEKPMYVGNKAEELRGLLKIRYPMEHGIVQPGAWGDMEAVWAHTFDELKVKPEAHPILLTEAPLNPRRNREKSAEIFFETFNVPALFVSLQAVLSLYASGRTTGVILDVGDGVAHSVPIFEGFAIPHAVMRVNVAGRDVTEHLQTLLRRAGYDFHTSAEREVVRAIKEAVCYVAFDPAKEEELLETENRGKPIHTTFKLPDGNSIEIGPERFRAPEVLFRPELIGEEYPGVHEMLTHSIGRTDLDLRRTLYSRIVLSGGSTLFPGFGDRFLNEVKNLAPKEIKIKISAPPERKYSTWIGGSILANLPTFKKMWVSHEEYEEEGMAAIHRKTF